MARKKLSLNKNDDVVEVVEENLEVSVPEVEEVEEVKEEKEEMFKVKLNKSFGVYIGNSHYCFQKGKSYNVPYGVKRYLIQTNCIIPE